LSPVPPPPRPRDWDPPWGALVRVPHHVGVERRLIPRHQILLVGKVVLAKGLTVDCARFATSHPREPDYG
jgi:hypothetical protein